jgi:serine protease AprX
MRRAFLGVALIGAFGLLIVATAVAGSAERPLGVVVGAVGAPTTADLEGDKVFDDLSDQLNGIDAGDDVKVIVRLTGKLTRARADSVKHLVGPFRYDAWLPIIDGFAATVTKSQVAALASLDSVTSIEKNGVVRALNNSAQASFGVTQARLHQPSLDGDRNNNVNQYVPDDVVVAVIDTGIDAAHPQLDEGKVMAFVNCQQPVSGTCTPTTALDDNDHGTHVAGTVAGDGDNDANYKGVAPAAGLVGIKVLDDQGSGTDAEVIAGIQWAVANRVLHGIDVINLSLGSSGCNSGTDGTAAAANAAAATLVVVVAAGNEGPETCTVGSPGSAQDVITVGAMADTGVTFGPLREEVPGFNQAYFSSRGPTLDARVKPDISAPGVQITSADANSGGAYQTFNGTSMATPFVAGVAALMLDHNGTLTHAQIKSTLMSTAVDWGPSGPDIDYGAGRLDAFAAIKALGGTTLGGPPPAPSHALVSGSLTGTGDFAVHPVQVPATEFPIAATLIMTAFVAGQTDFDLYLYAPDGTTLLLSSEFTTRQEEVGALPTNAGTYFLRVESFEGSGPYILDISVGTPASPPPQPQPLPQPPPQPPLQPPPPTPPPPPPLPPSVRPPAPLARCVVPNVKRKTVVRARRLLAARRCALGRVRRTYSARVRKGWIISQSRRPGARLLRGTRVGVVVSRGRRR